MTDGGETAVAADDQGVSMAEFRSLQKKVQQLEKVLGRKTLENEILKEAVRIGREKNSSRPSHCKASRISNDGDFCCLGDFPF